MTQPYIEARYHGGQCCGMSHISNFPMQPTAICDAVERQTEAERNQQRNDYYGIRFNYTRPRETAKERLIAVISGLSQVFDPAGFGWSARRSGILEVVLITAQKRNWNDTLTELGFKEVNSCRNSNSNRTIHVFHKNTGAA